MIAQFFFEAEGRGSKFFQAERASGERSMGIPNGLGTEAGRFCQWLSKRCASSERSGSHGYSYSFAVAPSPFPPGGWEAEATCRHVSYFLPSAFSSLSAAATSLIYYEEQGRLMINQLQKGKLLVPMRRRPTFGACHTRPRPHELLSPDRQRLEEVRIPSSIYAKVLYSIQTRLYNSSM